jgi:hypothetical protein
VRGRRAGGEVREMLHALDNYEDFEMGRTVVMAVLIMDIF